MLLVAPSSYRHMRRHFAPNFVDLGLRCHRSNAPLSHPPFLARTDLALDLQWLMLLFFPFLVVGAMVPQ